MFLKEAYNLSSNIYIYIFNTACRKCVQDEVLKSMKILLVIK